jgi:S1-C subfamily serine protease
MRAALRGANALTDLACESTGFSWGHNCTDSITCYAEAIVVSDVRPAKRVWLSPPKTNTLAPTPSPSNISIGTGWTVSQGLAVTNWHVVEGHSRITLQFRGGRRVGARVHLKDALNEVALLMPEEEDPNRPAIPLAGEIPEMGETVFTIGFPAPDLMGQQPKLTSGVVSSLSGIEDDPRFIQMSVPTQPGNSGGPLLNRKGEAIGMVTAKLNPTYALKSSGFLPENVGYAIKGRLSDPASSRRDGLTESAGTFTCKSGFGRSCVAHRTGDHTR